jgi:hypothetical protein
MANYSEFESATSGGQDGSASNDAGQLDSAEIENRLVREPVERRREAFR